MNLLPTSEQEQILDAAKVFLDKQAPLERLRFDRGQIGNQDHLLWPALGELGFWGISLDEGLGGSGLSVCEEYLLYREFGRRLVSLGALGLTLGARLAALGGQFEVADAMLNGRVRVAIANARGQTVAGPRGPGQWHLLEGRDADWVVEWSPKGAALFRSDQWRVLEDVLAMDSHMTLLRGELADPEPVVFVPSARENLRLRALALIAAYGVGVAEMTRDRSVEYAKIRQQFGQPIGKFQAVKHRCADMAIRAEVAYCQATYAAVALSENTDDQELQVISAKLLAVDSALRNSADNIQNHGAFGFTAEGDAHLFLKRAHTLDFLSGDQRRQKADLLRQSDPSGHHHVAAG